MNRCSTSPSKGCNCKRRWWGARLKWPNLPQTLRVCGGPYKKKKKKQLQAPITNERANICCYVLSSTSKLSTTKLLTVILSTWYSVNTNLHNLKNVGYHLWPILNFAPRGDVVLQGWILSPGGEVIPWGVKLSPPFFLTVESCHSRGWTKGWTFPLGDKFHPGGQGWSCDVKNGPLAPAGAPSPCGGT
jgi:hypothetical protein